MQFFNFGGSVDMDHMHMDPINYARFEVAANAHQCTIGMLATYNYFGLPMLTPL